MSDPKVTRIPWPAEAERERAIRIVAEFGSDALAMRDRLIGEGRASASLLWARKAQMATAIIEKIKAPDGVANDG